MALNQFNRFVYVSLFSCIFFPHAMHSANVNQQWKQNINENNNKKTMFGIRIAISGSIYL